MLGILLIGCIGAATVGCDDLMAVMTETQGGRVQRPAAGFAITFPDDWTIRDATAGDRSQSETWLDPGFDILPQPLIVAVPPTLHDRCTVEDLAPLAQAHGGWTSVEDALDWSMSRLDEDPRWVGVEGGVVELPAGRSGYLRRSVAAEAAYVTTYVVMDGPRWFSLECISPEPSAALWGSIAESFTFLPVDE